MKTVYIIAAGLLASLVISSQFPASESVVAEAKRYFSDDEISLGQTFSRDRRWIFWGNTTVQFLLLGLLALTRFGSWLTERLGRFVGGRWLLHVAAVGAVYWIASWLLGLPFRIASFHLSRDYGMTTQPFEAWFNELLLHFAVATALEGVVFLGFYVLMRWFPRSWWAVAGVGSVAVGFGFAMILPEYIAPLFNTFTPLEQTRWKSLAPRIRAIAEQADVSVGAIFVVDSSRQGGHSNAYFTGFGPTQKIVLFDTLLAKHGDDEVETIVAHEMGHWLERHIIKGILGGGLGLIVGLWLLHRHLRRFVDARAWSSAADPRGVGLVLLIGHLAFAATMPIQNVISRHFERQADQISLDLAKKPEAFIEAELNLARFNKSNVAPSDWNVMLFSTHPPVVERIRMAEDWRTR